MNSISNASDTTRRLLILLSDLEFGGGQISTVRLANALAAKGEVYLYNLRPKQADESVIARLAPAVRQLPSTGSAQEVCDYIRDLRIDTVNTHIWWADAFYHRVMELLPPEQWKPRWVLSMHGCYELLQVIPWLDPYYESNGDAVLNDTDAIVYTADKNVTEIKARLPIAAKAEKVWYGYDCPKVNPVSRPSLGIGETDFVFGLVSRPIPEKGWECAIEALQIVREKGFSQSHLLLVGGSPYQEELMAKYATAPHVHFTGAVADPQNFVAMFDVGLLPSWFISESLPNSIIEYLSQAKPVIATALGEVGNMLRDGDDLAGILLPGQPDHPLAPETLAGAMMEMLRDPERVQRFSAVAERAARRFDMEKWVSNYWRILFPVTAVDAERAACATV